VSPHFQLCIRPRGLRILSLGECARWPYNSDLPYRFRSIQIEVLSLVNISNSFGAQIYLNPSQGVRARTSARPSRSKVL